MLPLFNLHNYKTYCIIYTAQHPSHQYIKQISRRKKEGVIYIIQMPSTRPYLINENIKTTLNARQMAFVMGYLQTGNIGESYINAGYKCKPSSARINGSQLLSRPAVKAEIARLQKELFVKNTASAEEVMDFFSRVMRGEVKDQFGLETSVSDRIKAAQELAKRTVDIELRTALPEPKIEITLDWGRALPSSQIISNISEEKIDSTSTQLVDDGVEFEVVEGENTSTQAKI